MKFFIDLVLYMAVGGLIVGLAANSYKERCGKNMDLNSETMLVTATWPAILVVSIIIDEDYKKPSCE